MDGILVDMSSRVDVEDVNVENQAKSEQLNVRLEEVSRLRAELRCQTR